MRRLLALVPIVFVACNTAPPPPPVSATAATPGEAPQARAIEPPAHANDNLSDLDAMTFACPKAALNAAAREAAKAPSQGTYQFSFFRIVSNSHHAQYEVRFKSNYHGEPDLKYCVTVYCQQGWDPKTSKTTVQRFGDGVEPHALGADGHGRGCAADEPVGKAKRKKKS